MFSLRFRFLVAAIATISCVAVHGNALAATADVTIDDPHSFTDSFTGTSVASIHAGDTVTWRWAAGDHSTTSGTCSGGGIFATCTPDGNWDSGLQPKGHLFSRTFPTAGTFTYYCRNHLNMMKGTVFVGAAVTPPPPPLTCTADSTTLCIDDVAGDRRFKVQVHFETAQGGGQSGDGQAIPLSSLRVTEGGLFWFFSANNPELLVKIVNGCAVNQRWWVFASAGTNVGATITVTDTSDGSAQTYVNPDLTPMAAIQDTSAFSNCR